MCNLLITLYLPFSINSKVIASHIIWKLQQKGFINYTSMVYRMILWLQGRLIKRLQRKLKKKKKLILQLLLHPEKDYEFNIYQLISWQTTAIEQLLGLFLYSDAYWVCIPQSLTRSGIISFQFFFSTACRHLSLHLSFTNTLYFSYVRSSRST